MDDKQIFRHISFRDLVCIVLLCWLVACKICRYQRIRHLESKYSIKNMTTADARDIIKTMAELEDPLIFKMAVAIGMLMVGAEKSLIKSNADKWISLECGFSGLLARARPRSI